MTIKLEREAQYNIANEKVNKNFFFSSTLINSLFYKGVKRGEKRLNRKGSQE